MRTNSRIKLITFDNLATNETVRGGIGFKLIKVRHWHRKTGIGNLENVMHKAINVPDRLPAT